MLYQRLKEVMSRPEVQRNPLQALSKRISWRLRWLGTKEPFVIPLGDTLKIAIPKTGSGAAIYYRGFSEPDTSDFVQRFLRPGMVMMDVGAHIGEYTLLAAQAVGDAGQIHAFEPQEPIFPILSNNVRLNGFKNVTLNASAVSDRVGELEFEIVNEPSMSSIRKHEILDRHAKVVKVPTTSLDVYWSNHTSKIDLIKVDVEGAEKFVFQGATELMSLHGFDAPTWIFEYGPRAYADFDYQPAELLDLIRNYGYSIWQYSVAGQINPFDPNKQLPDIVNLIATKDKSHLLSLLQGTDHTSVAHRVRA
jgi:FkbM family methyltransferase